MARAHMNTWSREISTPYGPAKIWIYHENMASISWPASDDDTTLLPVVNGVIYKNVSVYVARSFHSEWRVGTYDQNTNRVGMGQYAVTGHRLNPIPKRNHFMDELTEAARGALIDYTVHTVREFVNENPDVITEAMIIYYNNQASSYEFHAEHLEEQLNAEREKIWEIDEKLKQLKKK